ncbi:MAG TPA: hydantoinase/oxoprolinase family protein, partial [Terriglobales bacterium]|nr:hydantoinase/oxoprolinase family protein [Terriglobales bacterium]
RILREYREYERTSTTVVNAYVGPIVARYLGSLEEQFRRKGFSGEVLVMQSGGGVMSLPAAVQMPVRMMESGPVAGVIGAAKVAASLGYPQAIAFDMGGTTAKASLTQKGDAQIANHYYIGGYNTGHPVMLPVVDIVEVGSGGGSIAWLDAAGGLKVGPLSSGAEPGPACYGRGGTEPTVTDANLVLGRLGDKSFLGGEMALNRAAATDAIQKRIAGPLDLDIARAAVAILRIANAHMALALRAVSVERGRDPRDFCLVASGGAGPLHGCTLARELKIPTVIIPCLPGQFSAWGMLTCDLRQDYVQTLVRDYTTVSADEIQAALTTLLNTGLDALGRNGVNKDNEVSVDCRLDLRYRGQEYSIPVSLPGTGFGADDREPLAARFHELHGQLYGHAAPEEALELVGVRLTIHRSLDKHPSHANFPTPASQSQNRVSAYTHRRAYMGEHHDFIDTGIYRRSELIPGAQLQGPAIIEEAASTTVVLPGDHVSVMPTGELVIRIAPEDL